MPSTSVSVPKLKRGIGCSTSMPTVAIMIPSSVATTPLAMLSLSTMMMTTSANSTSENLPGVRISSDSSAATGMKAISSTVPMQPPIIDPRAAWPSALAPWPFSIS